VLFVFDFMFRQLSWFVYFRHHDWGPQGEFRDIATEA